MREGGKKAEGAGPGEGIGIKVRGGDPGKKKNAETANW